MLAYLKKTNVPNHKGDDEDRGQSLCFWGYAKSDRTHASVHLPCFGRQKKFSSWYNYISWMVILRKLNIGNRIWDYKVQWSCRNLTEKKLLISILGWGRIHKKGTNWSFWSWVERMFQKPSFLITVIERPSGLLFVSNWYLDFRLKYERQLLFKGLVKKVRN